MKRYIRASFDNEVPSWLIADKKALKALSQAGVDLKKAVFSREKSAGRGADYVIYKLPSNWGGSQPWSTPIIYIPEVYSSVEKYSDMLGSGERKRIEYFSKKRLAEMAEDIVYVNKADSAKAYRDHYKDPRYENGKYMGQTLEKDSYENDKWTYKWTTSGKYTGGRFTPNVRHDKSGYAIPDPKDRLARFYGTSAGLDSIARKVERIYDNLLDLKEDIFSVDFSDFGLDFEGNKYPASCTYGNMLSRFGNAVREYRLLLDKISGLKANGNVSRYTVSSIMDHIKSIEYSVRDARHALETQRD